MSNPFVDSSHLPRSLRRKQDIVRAAMKHPQFTANPLLLLLDLDAVAAKCRALNDAFPKHFLHRFAVKANGNRSFLQFLLENNVGLEAASFGELSQALRAGASSTQIVYDSPLKPRAELRKILELRIPLNIDNYQELAVIDELLTELDIQPDFPIGMRINPQVGAGKMEGYSTGTATAKFGVGLLDNDSKPLFEVYEKYPWLTAVHCHVGSQGIDVALAMSGIKATANFALAVNKKLGKKQIDTIDIGGGLSVNFASDEVTPTFKDYAHNLKIAVPELFDDTFQHVITEFGRAIVAKEGFMLSKCEYSKITGGRHIVIQYAGADVAVRTIFKPKQWVLRISVVDQMGEARGGWGVPKLLAQKLDNNAGLHETDIAGPCCIQADIVGHKRMLPPCRPGDFFIIHDVGGYYVAQHSRYNLRQMPAMWVYNQQQEIQVWQGQETIDQVIDAFHNI